MDGVRCRECSGDCGRGRILARCRHARIEDANVSIFTVVLDGIWLCLMRQKWRYIVSAVFCRFFSGMPAKPDILKWIICRRLADGQLKFGTGSQKSFTANKWPEQSCQSGARAENRLRCVERLNLYAGPHPLVRRPSAFEEDCLSASWCCPVWRRTVCNGKIPGITKRQLRKSGAHMVYLVRR